MAVAALTVSGQLAHGDVCGFLLRALLKLLSPSHGQVSLFFFLCLISSFLLPWQQHDNGQEPRKKHYLSTQSKKHCWYEENRTSHRGGLFLTFRFSKRRFSLDLSLLPFPPDRLPNIVLKIKETVLISSQEKVSCISKCSSFLLSF